MIPGQQDLLNSILVTLSFPVPERGYSMTRFLMRIYAENEWHERCRIDHYNMHAKETMSAFISLITSTEHHRAQNLYEDTLWAKDEEYFH